ncbi:hypothetical protein ACTFIR_010321 [Dictyostelium discoideum]
MEGQQKLKTKNGQKKTKPKKKTSSIIAQQDNYNNMENSGYNSQNDSEFDPSSSSSLSSSSSSSSQQIVNNNNNQQQQQQPLITNITTPPNNNNNNQILEDIYSDEYCENQMKCMEGFIKKWKDEYIGSIKGNVEHHQIELNNYTFQLSELKQERLFLQQYKESNQRTIELQIIQLQRINNEIESIEKNRHQLPIDLESKKLKYQEETQRILTLSSTIKSIEDQTIKQLLDLDYPLTLFKNYLGLEFQKLSNGDGLKLIFTKIDRNNHNREFTISITVDNLTDQYILVNCNPMISDLDQSIKKLNETGNFSFFVKSIRKQFVNKTIHK